MFHKDSLVFYLQDVEPLLFVKTKSDLAGLL